MKRLSWALPALAVLLLSIGCSLLPSQKHDAAATKAVDSIASQQSISIEKTVDISPPRWVVPGPILDAPSASVNGNAPSPSEPRNSKSGIAPQSTSSPSTLPPSKADATLPLLLSPSYHAEVKLNSSSGQTGGSATQAASDEKSTLPAGVKLILLGIGIVVVTAGLIFAWRHLKTTAVGQGIALGDAALKSQIDIIRSKLATTTDSARQAEHNAAIAQLEAERGKLQANAP
jgi:hypothetical protein